MMGVVSDGPRNSSKSQAWVAAPSAPAEALRPLQENEKLLAVLANSSI